MALGAATQHIVTDTEHTAKNLIEFLRQNRLGRATFLPVSAMLPRTLDAAERKVLSMKGCLGVASELCDYPEIYRGVMENLLGRTVIAEDLDCGVKIMRAGNHQFRLVTLEGDVMHAGGSMTGGSAQQKAQNLLGRDRMIRELKTGTGAKERRAGKGRGRHRQTDQTAGRNAAAGGGRALRAAAAGDRRGARHRAAVVRQGGAGAAPARLPAVHDAVAQLSEDIAELNEPISTASPKQAAVGAPDTEAMAEKTNSLSAELNAARRERERTQEVLTAAMLSLQQAEHQCDRIRRDSGRLDEERQNLREGAGNPGAEKGAGAASHRDRGGRPRAGRPEASWRSWASVKAAEEAVSPAEQERAAAQKALKELQAETEGVRLQLDKAVERQHRQEMSLERAKAELSQLDQRLVGYLRA